MLTERCTAVSTREHASWGTIEPAAQVKRLAQLNSLENSLLCMVYGHFMLGIDSKLALLSEVKLPGFRSHLRESRK